MRNRLMSMKLSEFILCILVASVPLNHISLPGVGAVYQIVLLIVAFIYIWLLIKEKNAILSFEAEKKIWFILLMHEAISVVWSENSQRSMNQLIGMTEVFIIAILILNEDYSDSFRKSIYNSALFSGIIYMIYALFFTESQIYTGRKIITFGAFGSMDPNEWCSYIILPVAIAILRVIDEKRYSRKVFYTIYILMTVYCALLEGSRGGMLSILVTLLFVITKKTRLNINVLISAPILLVGIGVVVWKLILPQIPETVLARYTIDGMSAYGGAGGRGELWIELIEFLWNNPLRLIFGVGLYGAKSVPYVAHNHFLQVFLDTGIIGLLLYLYFVLRVHRQAVRRGVIEAASFWGMQVALLSLTGYSWLKSSWIVIIICLIKCSNKEENQNDYIIERERTVP